ncbi:MAG: class I SAM-dependent methyltransferase [Thermoleophilia bacterium]|nr:class I SAM-dependent methyltransferase [Thermoleophilia bacterium]
MGWTPEPSPAAPAAPGRGPAGALGRLARALAAAELRRLLPGVGPGMLVMDVGAGAGLRADALLGLGARVLALEPDPVEAMRATTALRGRAVVRSVGLAELEPHAVRADAVLCWHVLEHLPDLDLSLARMRDALRPGGTLLVAVPNAGGAEARLLGGRWQGWEPARHRWHLTRHALRNVLTGAGLADIRIAARGGWAPALGLAASVAPSLDPQLTPSPLPGLALAAALTPVSGLARLAGAGPQLVAVARRP